MSDTSLPPLAPIQPQDPDVEYITIDEAMRRSAAQMRAGEDKLFMAQFAQAAKDDPELAAEANRLGVSLGLDPVSVRENVPFARKLLQEKRARMVAVAAENSDPILWQQLHDPKFAYVAHDDIDNLDVIAKAKRGWNIGELQSERLRLGYQKLRSGGELTDEDARRFAEIDKQLSETPGPTGVLGNTGYFLGLMAQTVPNAIAVGTATGIGYAGTAWAAGTLGPQLLTPEEVVTLPSAFVTGFAHGFFGATVLQTFQMEAGDAYLTMRENNFSHDEAQGAAVAIGALNAGLEAGALGYVTAPARHAISRSLGRAVLDGIRRPTYSEAAKQFAIRWVKSIGVEASEEVAQELTQIIGEEAARLKVGRGDVTSSFQKGETWQRVVDTAIATVEGMALIGGISPAIAAHYDLQLANTANKKVEAFQREREAKAKSKLAERDPEQYRVFTNRAAEQTDVSTVYIDGQQFQDALRQTKITEEDADKLIPGLKKQIDTARRNSGILIDITIPSADYEAKIAGTPLGDALDQHRRFDPDGPSVSESTQVKEIAAEIEKEAGPEVEKRVRELSETAKIRQEIAGQLRGAGRLPHNADLETQLLGAFVEQNAARLGVTPREYWDANRPRIRAASPGEIPEGAAGLYQPNFNTILLDPKSNASTLVHELAHWHLDQLAAIAANPKADVTVAQDLRTLLDWHGYQGSLQDWAAKPFTERESFHEQVALGVENWIAEGNAPSVELQPIFSRLAAWMRRVYRNIRDQLSQLFRDQTGKDLPDLTPAVRSVFERMVADEDAIKYMRSIRRHVPMFQTQEQSGLSDQDWKAYRQQFGEDEDQAVAELNRRSLASVQWTQNQLRREESRLKGREITERKRLRDEETKRLSETPVYRARRYLQTGKIRQQDGTEVQTEGPHRLDAAAVKALGLPGTENLGYGRYGLLAKEGGAHPDAVASLLGYRTGADLVKVLLAAPRFSEAVQAAVQARLDAEFGYLTDPKQRARAIHEALHNRIRARLVADELRAAEGALRPTRVLTAAAKLAARKAIDSTVIRQLRPDVFSRLEAKASKDAHAAMREGDPTAVRIALRRRLYYAQLAELAVEQDAAIDKALAGFDKIWRADSKLGANRQIELVRGARFILAAFGLGRGTRPVAEDLAQVERYAPDAWKALAPIVARATQSAQDYRNLTVAQFDDLVAAVDGLWYLSGQEKAAEIAGKTVQIAEIVGALTGRLQEIGIPHEPGQRPPGQAQAITDRDRSISFWQTIRAYSRRIEHWADAMDGPDGPGPFTRFLTRPVFEAVETYRGRFDQYLKRYLGLLEALDLPKGEIDGRKYGIDYVFGSGNGGYGKTELLGALLHSGNESNLYRLLLGRKWSRKLADGTVDYKAWQGVLRALVEDGTLTKADFDWAQTVWDLFEELKPDWQKAHRGIYGYLVKEVPATPIETPWGTYRGGYAPAKADPDVVNPNEYRALSIEDIANDARRALPATPDGFTKERTDVREPNALSLDIRLGVQHLDEVLRFAHVQPAVHQVLRVLRNPDFRSALLRIDPTAVDRLIPEWLKRTVQQTVTKPGSVRAIDAFWSAVRKRSGLGFLFANARNVLQQSTGLSTAAAKDGVRRVSIALGEYTKAPRQTMLEVEEASPAMARRFKNRTYELRDQIEDITKRKSTYASLQAYSERHAYFAQHLFQNVVDVIAWKAAYAKSIESSVGVDDTVAHRDAVAYADSSVRQTQGDFNPESVAEFEVGTPFLRIFSQFNGYFNTLANLNATEFTKLVRDVGLTPSTFAFRALPLYVLAFAAPMLAASLISNLLGGRGPFGEGDDDPDGDVAGAALSWFFAEQFKGALSFLPFGNQFVQLTNAFNGKPYDDRLGSAPTIKALEDATFGVARAAKEIAGGELKGRAIQNIATGLTLLTGLPFTAVAKPIAYLQDVSRGTKELPSNVVEAARAVVTGTAPTVR